MRFDVIRLTLVTILHLMILRHGAFPITCVSVLDDDRTGASWNLLSQRETDLVFGHLAILQSKP